MRSMARLYLLAVCWGLLLAGTALSPARGQGSGQPQLSLSATVDRSVVEPGGVIVYTIRYGNAGPGMATGVAINDALPLNTTFVSASSGGILLGSSVFWTPGNLQPGQDGSVTLQVRVNNTLSSGTTITNSAQISSVEVPLGVLGGSVNVTVGQAPAAPGLAVTVGANTVTASPGSQVMFLLTVTNSGAGPATNVTLSSPIPASTTPVFASDGGVVSNGTAVWSFGTLGPNSSRQVSLGLQVNSNATGTLTGTAQAVSSEVTTPILGNSVSVTVNPINAIGFAGTYRLIAGVANPTSITVDPQNRLTVISVAGGGLTPGLGAQGTLNLDGSFDVIDPSGRQQFTGRINPDNRSATVSVRWPGLLSYAIDLPRAPDFSSLPPYFVGTFSGTATAPWGDRLVVLLSIDPGGNSTFQADLVQFFPLSVRHRSGSYQVTAEGLVGANGRADGSLQVAGNSLLLTYNFAQTGYQYTFQVPLVRR